MQFDKDLNSNQAELFLAVREYIIKCIGKDTDERYRDNITSYYSKEGGFCYLRTYHDYIHIGWFRGVHIEDKYNLLFGSGKTIRGQRIKKFDKKIKKSIAYYIEQTFFFLIEHNELKKLKIKKILKI